MKAHLYVVSTGVIAFGILGGNFTFNTLQCKQQNSTNSTNSTKVVDHVFLHEWCNATCYTSGLLVTASPWILVVVLCTSVLFYYLLPHHVDKVKDEVYDKSVYDIGVSLGALSLNWDDDYHHNSSNHGNTSWFSELNKLDLFDVNSSLPVTKDTTGKQILSPPKLKLHCTFQPNQCDKRMSDEHCVNNNKHYHIIVALSCLLSLSVTCNVVLIYWITYVR